MKRIVRAVSAWNGDHPSTAIGNITSVDIIDIIQISGVYVRPGRTEDRTSLKSPALWLGAT